MTPKRRYYDIGLQIEGLLHSGVYHGGDRLPSERELSEKFEASRATIREAIIMLELKGLIEVRQGAGIYFVDCPQSLNQKRLMPLSDVGVFELLQARIVIEPNITAFAAKRISLPEIKELKTIYEQQKAELHGSNDRFEELDRQFHNKIADSTQNRVLVKQVADLWQTVRTDNPLWKRLNEAYLHSEELKLRWLDDHHQILIALQMRDPEAAHAACKKHIEQSRAELLKLVDTSEDYDEEDLFFSR